MCISCCVAGKLSIKLTTLAVIYIVSTTAAVKAYRPKRISTLAIAPSLTATTNIATTKTSNIDHFPNRCIQCKYLPRCTPLCCLALNNLYRTPIFNSGNTTLNPVITINKKYCCSCNKPKAPLNTEKLFSNNKNFVIVMIGVTSPVIKTISVIASSILKRSVSVGKKCAILIFDIPIFHHSNRGKQVVVNTRQLNANKYYWCILILHAKGHQSLIL